MFIGVVGGSGRDLPGAKPVEPNLRIGRAIAVRATGCHLAYLRRSDVLPCQGRQRDRLLVLEEIHRSHRAEAVYLVALVEAVIIERHLSKVPLLIGSSD